MKDRDRVMALLAERGAASLDHPGGTLLEHLVRVANLLDEWGASVDLAMARLAHAAYGTEGFDDALFELDERSRRRGIDWPPSGTDRLPLCQL
jgi:hypothetical protein